MNTRDAQLKAIAEKVLAKADIKSDENFGSFIAILMVVSIILSAIRILQECNKNKLSTLRFAEKCDLYGAQIKEISVRKSWFTKLRIKKIIRRELDSSEYKKYGQALTNAILDIGESLKDDEIKCLLEAANV
jgi:hypothetical protein